MIYEKQHPDIDRDKPVQIDQLIRTEAIGSPEHFAGKFKLAKSTMYEYLNNMKELGAEILFDRQRNCFKHKRPYRLQLLKPEIIDNYKLDEIKSEKKYFNKFSQLGFLELTNFTFVPWCLLQDWCVEQYTAVKSACQHRQIPNLG